MDEHEYALYEPTGEGHSRQTKEDRLRPYVPLSQSAAQNKLSRRNQQQGKAPVSTRASQLAVQNKVSSKNQQQGKASVLKKVNNYSNPVVGTKTESPTKPGLNESNNERGRSTATVETYAQKRARQYNQDWSIDVQRYPELSYAPQRIPGYLPNSPRTLYGFVMRELLSRIVPEARIESAKSILIVSRDVPETMDLIDKYRSSNRSTSEEELHRQVNFSVGGSALINCFEKGHSCHALYDGHDGSKMQQSDHVGEWWVKFNKNATQPKPSSLLLMMIDSYRSDEVLKQSLVLMENKEVSYFVVSFGADPQENMRIYGVLGIHMLLEHGYKVMLLSISHVDSPYKSTQQHKFILGPNEDITREGIQSFESEIRKRAELNQEPVRGYVFATLGLDRPIPLASDYLEAVSEAGIVYKQCPASVVDLQFISHNQSLASVHCNNKEMDLPALSTSKTVAKFDNVLWHSETTLVSSEAICVRLRANSCKLPIGLKVKAKHHEFFSTRMSGGRVSCTTRILPSHANNLPSLEGRKRPNVLVVNIDPMSRARFERSLPKTKLLLQRLDFVSFPQYTTVNNKGALFSGMNSPSTVFNANKTGRNATRQWLWDALSEQGYATLKAGNVCSKTIFNADHGRSFNRLMCTSFFHRPNCIGAKPAAQHLFNYSTHFIQTYSNLKRPWAAFLHLMDAGEDTQILEGTMDDPLWHFLYSIHEGRHCSETKRTHSIPCRVWDNTVIIVNSESGIYHGSYSQSPDGLKERAQPIMSLRVPPAFLSSEQKNVIQRNSKFFTTPYDVHETLRDVLFPDQAASHRLEDQTGRSLVRHTLHSNSCASTPGLPKRVCDLLHPRGNKTIMMRSPPSGSSFYADVPARQNLFINEPQNDPTLYAPNQECVCATDKREGWFNCSKHISPAEYANGTSFSMVDCGGDNHAYKVHVKTDESLLQRSRNILAREKEKPRPSIVFLEIDSVSRAYADRHLPRTRELLAKYRIKEKESHSFDCDDERWCSADFRSFAVVGPNSIPNQISYMSGCIVTTGPEHCVNTTLQDGTGREICNERNHRCYGLKFVRQHRTTKLWCELVDDGQDGASSSPWLFDIAKLNGYVSLFAEEFCWEGGQSGASPYVAQDNLFDLDADFLPHKYFCREAELQLSRQGRREPPWKYEGSQRKGNFTFSYITSFLEAYKDVPKLVYLNSLAAHVYAGYATMTLQAEAYDVALANFLESILKREEEVIVIVRGDHGLQGGPVTSDYAVQVEALRPWSEVIVPKSLPGLSLSHLFSNQHALATGFDLYKTLTSTIMGKDPSLMPEPPTWTYNLWQQTVPTRTCEQAHVPAPYCIYEELRTFTAPNLGTCNLAEDDQRFLCPVSFGDFYNRLNGDVDSKFNAEAIEEVSCKNRKPGVSELLQRTWEAIDNQTNLFPDAKVSGGIFLYPRQAELLTAVVKRLAVEMRQNENRKLRICETGFGAGHSAAMWLEASANNIELHLFDKFDRPYQKPVVAMLKKVYPDQNIKHYPGNSCVVVPKVLFPIRQQFGGVKCDVLHASSFCPTDSIDLVERSPCGTLLTATAMNSLTRNNVYFGPRGQWTNLLNRGCIQDVACYTEDEKVLDRDYVFKPKGAAFTHKFCTAISTGKCQRFGKQRGLQHDECSKSLANVTHFRLNSSQLCKDWQITPEALTATAT